MTGAALDRTGMPAWLSPVELALRWKCSVRTLARWRADRYGPAWYELGGRILYCGDDITDFEATHRRRGS